MAAWGGLIIAVKLSMPNMPMLETVIVPPWYSSGLRPPSRALVAEVLGLARDLGEPLAADVPYDGGDEALVEGHGHRHVHLLVQLYALAWCRGR